MFIFAEPSLSNLHFCSKNSRFCRADSLKCPFCRAISQFGPKKQSQLSFVELSHLLLAQIVRSAEPSLTNNSARSKDWGSFLAPIYLSDQNHQPKMAGPNGPKSPSGAILNRGVFQFKTHVLNCKNTSVCKRCRFSRFCTKIVEKLPRLHGKSKICRAFGPSPSANIFVSFYFGKIKAP